MWLLLLTACQPPSWTLLTGGEASLALASTSPDLGPLDAAVSGYTAAAGSGLVYGDAGVPCDDGAIGALRESWGYWEDPHPHGGLTVSWCLAGAGIDWLDDDQYLKLDLEVQGPGGTTPKVGTSRPYQTNGVETALYLLVLGITDEGWPEWVMGSHHSSRADAAITLDSELEGHMTATGLPFDGPSGPSTVSLEARWRFAEREEG